MGALCNLYRGWDRVPKKVPKKSHIGIFEFNFAPKTWDFSRCLEYPLVSPPVSEVPLYLYELVQYANGRVFDTQSVGLVVHGFDFGRVPS